MNILEGIQNCPVEWKELGEVCEVKAGKNINKTFIQNNLGNFPVINSGKEPLGYINIFNTQNDPIGITSRGAGVGYVSWNEGKYFRGNLNYSATVQNEEVLLPRFLYFYLKNSSKEIENLCTFDGIPALNKSALEGLLIPIPSLEIQEKIVQILDKMTGYVTELTSELTSRKKQYSFYRDKLLSFEDEVYQVEWKTLGELFVFKNGLNKGKEFFGSGTPIVNYTDVYKNKKISSNILKGKVRVSNEEVERYGIQRGDVFFTRTSETQEEIGKTSVLLDEVKDGVFSGFVLRARPITKLLLPEYCAYCFESTTFRRDIVRYSTYTTRALTNGSTLSKLKIPVPSLEIQSRIVQVLDNFEMVCNDLNIGLPKEIELRQKQYEYFREKLLTFVAEGEYTESRVEEWDNSALIKLLQWVFGPIRVELGSICEFVRGNGLQKKDFTKVGKSVIHYGQIYTKYDFTVAHTFSKTSEMVFKKLKKAYPNDLIMATTSENVEDVGKAIVWEGKEEIGISGDSYIIRTSQNSRYLNYWLRSISFQSQKERKVTGTKVVRINSKDMEKFKIVLPPLTEQKRIVSILDNFNTLTNSLSEGLPKEIELRQKQYEYWREQLLYFNE